MVTHLLEALLPVVGSQTQTRASPSLEVVEEGMGATLVFGAGPHIFAWRVHVQTPPGGLGARVNGSAFGKPCEGAVVVCAWGGDPTFLHGGSGC